MKLIYSKFMNLIQPTFYHFQMVRKYLLSRFVDSLRIYVRGGAGGMGFPKYGGIGGKGGDVYVVAKDESKNNSLKEVKNRYPLKRFIAESGENSRPHRILGRPGEDKIIEVPVGISVVDEFGRVLGELNEAGDKVLVAYGGAGGNPSSNYCGGKSDGHCVLLDLKLIADIGLVGFPNAGKSTLLKAISRAKPKIASYPFTTIRPNIGVLQYSDHRQITMADLPGLIEGAHLNVGMGHSFLKHVERTKLLLMIVDIGGFQLSPQHIKRSCLETVILLNKELELYKPELLNKPALLLVNKMDIKGAEEKFKEIKNDLNNLSDVFAQIPDDIRPLKSVEFDDIIPISAKTDHNSVEIVKRRLRELLDFYAERERDLAEEESKLLNKLQRDSSEIAPRRI